MTNAELLVIYRGQCFACMVVALLILLFLASAAEQLIRDRIDRRRRDRLNHPMALRPGTAADRFNAA